MIGNPFFLCGLSSPVSTLIRPSRRSIIVHTIRKSEDTCNGLCNEGTLYWKLYQLYLQKCSLNFAPPCMLCMRVGIPIIHVEFYVCTTTQNFNSMDARRKEEENSWLTVEGPLLLWDLTCQPHFRPVLSMELSCDALTSRTVS